MKTNRLLFIVSIALAALGLSAPANSAPVAVIVEGALPAGQKASGLHDLQVTVHNAASQGIALAGPLTIPRVPVTNGRYRVELNLDNADSQASQAWIEVATRSTGGSGPFITDGTRVAVDLGEQKPAPAGALIGVSPQVTLQPEGAPPIPDDSPVGILAEGSFVGGGISNNATADFSTVTAGLRNTATGRYSFVGGGVDNWVSGEASVIPGGVNNQASGTFSFAAGRNANARHEGAFVWAAGGIPFESTLNNQFLILAPGGVGIGRNNPTAALDVAGRVKMDQFRLGTSSPGGSVLTSDFQGNGSWQPPTFRIQNNATSPNLIGGSPSNQIPSSVVGGFIGGGGAGFSNQFNRVLADFGTIAGGVNNAVSGRGSVISGGQANAASGTNATVAGGFSNTGSAGYTVVGGGVLNVASGSYATVAGGYNNAAAGTSASVAGGEGNAAVPEHSSIGGGSRNVIEASSPRSTIAGGAQNLIQSNSSASAIGGGQNNFIAQNTAGGVIAGGQFNRINVNSYSSTISGGLRNEAESDSGYSTIAGGSENVIQFSASFSSIGGGFNNSILPHAYAATIPGGLNNEAGGSYSFAAGRDAKARHSGSFVWADSGSAEFASTDANQFIIRATGGVGIGTTQPQATLDVTGSIRAGSLQLTQSPAAGLVLTSDADGLGTWASLPPPTHRLYPSADSPSLVAGYSGNSVYGWVGGVIGGGGSPGAIQTLERDYGFIGGGYGNTVRGYGGAIAGGGLNLAQGVYSFVAAGLENVAEGQTAAVGGGMHNRAGGFGGVVSGGFGNTTHQNYATIGGGRENEAVGYASAVLGGFMNQAAADYAVVGGGTINVASGVYAFIGNGFNNLATGDFAVVLGGQYNEARGANAMVPGGLSNQALGQASFAAGQQAVARHDGSFVWSDLSEGTFESTAANQFLIRAAGGVAIGTNDTAGAALRVAGTIQADSFLGMGTTLRLGTTDDQPLDLYVNNHRGLRLQYAGNNAYTTVNLIGGSERNFVAAGVVGATIGGGGANGSTNRVLTDFGTVGGGHGNESSGAFAVVGGGVENLAGASNATVGGGNRNLALADAATVAGGYQNSATYDYATVAGGLENSASGWNTAVGGGYANTAVGHYSMIGGGFDNIAGGLAATVAGGFNNHTYQNYATIGGGRENEAWGSGSLVSGGFANEAANDYATVAGGFANLAAGPYSAVGGGFDNIAQGFAATVAGGDNNVASGSSAVVPGGRANQALGEFSLAAGQKAIARHSGTFVWSDGSKGAFESTLANQFLIHATGGVGIGTNDTAGAALSVAGAIKAESFLNAGSPLRLGTTDNQPLELSVNGRRGLRLEYANDGISTGVNFIGGFSGNHVAPGTVGATIAGGGAFLQTNRVTGDFGTVGGGRLNTAEVYATIGGGLQNTARGLATVGGGAQNTANGQASTVSGGQNNVAAGYLATVGGGDQNAASSLFATTGGGRGNEASGFASTVSGGYLNEARNDHSFIGGGAANLASGSESTVGGGFSNSAGGLATTVGGGQFNMAEGENSTVPGGYSNQALGDSSFAAGRQAIARHSGSFVWSDASGMTFESTATNQFIVRASGGVGIGTNTPTAELEIAGRVKATDFEGDGSKLTGIKVESLGGGTVTGTVNFSPPSGAPFLVGNTVQVINLNADLVDGLDSTQIWKVGGNSGTAAGAQFLGTTDAQPLEFKVNSTRALRIEPGTDSPNLIAGQAANETTAGLSGSSILGGGSATRPNQVAANFATVVGGSGNEARGESSLAAGYRAHANHRGSFVWSDSTDSDLVSSAANEFIARASGGIRFFSTATMTAGVQLRPGSGAWSALSDRNAKENVQNVDSKAVLAKLAALPVQTWNYRTQDDSVRHMGPMAQDFHAAFGMGEDERLISTIDADGVALAAIQGLNQVVQEKDARINALEQQNRELNERLARLEQAVSSLAPRTSRSRN